MEAQFCRGVTRLILTTTHLFLLFPFSVSDPRFSAFIGPTRTTESQSRPRYAHLMHLIHLAKLTPPSIQGAASARRHSLTSLFTSPWCPRPPPVIRGAFRSQQEREESLTKEVSEVRDTSGVDQMRNEDDVAELVETGDAYREVRYRHKGEAPPSRPPRYDMYGRRVEPPSITIGDLGAIRHNLTHLNHTHTGEALQINITRYTGHSNRYYAESQMEQLSVNEEMSALAAMVGEWETRGPRRVWIEANPGRLMRPVGFKGKTGVDLSVKLGATSNNDDVKDDPRSVENADMERLLSIGAVWKNDITHWRNWHLISLGKHGDCGQKMIPLVETLRPVWEPYAERMPLKTWDWGRSISHHPSEGFINVIKETYCHPTTPITPGVLSYPRWMPGWFPGFFRQYGQFKQSLHIDDEEFLFDEGWLPDEPGYQCRVEEESNVTLIPHTGWYYQRFLLGSPPEDHGVTMAGILQMFLNSRSPGHAIVAINAAPLLSNATIPNVVDDLLSIGLNVRSIEFKTNQPEVMGVARVAMKGPGTLYAGMVEWPDFVECSNPETYICEVREHGFINLTMKIEWGRGLWTADEHGLYRIESEGIGQRTFQRRWIEEVSSPKHPNPKMRSQVNEANHTGINLMSDQSDVTDLSEAPVVSSTASPTTPSATLHFARSTWMPITAAFGAVKWGRTLVRLVASNLMDQETEFYAAETYNRTEQIMCELMTSSAYTPKQCLAWALQDITRWYVELKRQLVFDADWDGEERALNNTHIDLNKERREEMLRESNTNSHMIATPRFGVSSPGGLDSQAQDDFEVDIDSYYKNSTPIAHMSRGPLPAVAPVEFYREGVYPKTYRERIFMGLARAEGTIERRLAQLNVSDVNTIETTEFKTKVSEETIKRLNGAGITNFDQLRRYSENMIFDIINNNEVPVQTLLKETPLPYGPYPDPLPKVHRNAGSVTPPYRYPIPPTFPGEGEAHETSNATRWRHKQRKTSAKLYEAIEGMYHNEIRLRRELGGEQCVAIEVWLREWGNPCFAVPFLLLLVELSI
eukprot:GHVN01026304.1.p1 GENE.GHVN01026304.1~~GHVN01026304.1.p1  ORF type:complete len:1035 (-),score=196.01 GHVN01026304.1:1424-4528(-)